jgi:hypothetical protein
MKTAKEEVEEFNLNPIGVEVTYYPGTDTKGMATRTTKLAQVVDKRSVVWVEGHTGCVPLSHIKLR